jgi:predicted MFS family arabinose efflux permease
MKVDISKYGTLLTLYLAQSIPMTFFASVLPVIMRLEHFSLTSIGLLQLIKLPWLLKFLWAPVVDTASGDLIKYKKWIFSSELFYAVVIFSVAFFDISTDFGLIVILLVIAFTASATQDIATDAFSYLVLDKKQRSFGSSVQTIGNFLGTLLGSGVLLIIYHYLGWKYLIVFLAVFVLLALIPLFLYKIPATKEVESPGKKGLNPAHIYTFFKQKDIWKQIFLLTVFYWGIIGILTMQKPWLVDLGYSIKQIGMYSGVYGPAAGVVFALITGYIIRRAGLRKTMIIIFILNTLIGFYFWRLSFVKPEYWQIQLAVSGVWAVYSMGSVFVYTLIMNNIRKEKAGTDFTLQIVITHIGSMLIAVGSGKLAHQTGYKGLFFTEFIISLIVLLFFAFFFHYKKLNYDEF